MRRTPYYHVAQVGQDCPPRSAVSSFSRRCCLLFASFSERSGRARCRLAASGIFFLAEPLSTCTRSAGGGQLLLRARPACTAFLPRTLLVIVGCGPLAMVFSLSRFNFVFRRMFFVCSVVVRSAFPAILCFFFVYDLLEVAVV